MAMLSDGGWKGEPCWLVGGGPSLASLDWSLLRNVGHVVAVNMSYKDLPDAEVCFTEDVRFVELVKDREDWRNFKGVKLVNVLAESDATRFLFHSPDLTLLRPPPSEHAKRWSTTLADGLSQGTNSMVGALNLADIMGADPIYLLGVDCDPGERFTANYHDCYEKLGAQFGWHYQSFINDFEKWCAPHLTSRCVMNLNAKSHVSCWPKATLSYNEELRAILGRPAEMPQVW